MTKRLAMLIPRSLVGRIASALTCATLAVAGAAPARAQTHDDLLRMHARSLEGINLFVAPHATAVLNGLRLGGQLELARGRSNAWSGAGSVGWELRRGLRLTAIARRGSVGANEAARDDRTIGIMLDAGGRGLAASVHAVNANVATGTRELRGTEVRAWTELGDRLEIGLSMRSARIAEQGEAVDERKYVVAGYAFTATDRRNFMYVAERRDLEAQMTATLGGIRVTGVVGRTFADPLMSVRTWAWGRLAVPLPHGLELLAEAGRNDEGGLITQPPGHFARLGMRVDLGSRPDRRTPVPRTATERSVAVAVIEASAEARRLVIDSPAAAGIEVMGDFTAWQPRTLERLADGRWTFPLGAGVFRFNIRIDGGEWTVPAGVSVVADEFSGAPVAVIVVR